MTSRYPSQLLRATQTGGLPFPSPLAMADLSDANEHSEASFLTAVAETPHQALAAPKVPEPPHGFVEDQPLKDDTSEKCTDN